MDDFLIYADSFESCLNSVNFVVDLFKYFGIEINSAKSIDFLGYSLDAQKCRFTLTQYKLFKCRLIIKCLSRLRSTGVELLQHILGFLNFALQLFPLGRSFIRPWYKLANNFASSRVKLDPSHTLGMYFLKALFLHFALQGWPNHLCPVLSRPHLQGWLGFSGPGGFAFSLPALFSIFQAEFLASFYDIGMYPPISNNIHLVIWEFFSVSRDVHLVIYLLTKF